MTFTLEDGEERAAESDIFQIPSEDKRRSLKPGAFVKLMFHGLEVERMWVEVVTVGDGSYEGRLRNDPYCIPNLAFGDSVSFEPRHVIDIE